MPLKCQAAADLTRGVIDETVAKAEFNKKRVSLQRKTDFIRALLLRCLMGQEASGKRRRCTVMYQKTLVFMAADRTNEPLCTL